MDLWMQIEGRKLIFIMNFSVLELFKFASRMHASNCTDFSLDFQEFSSGACPRTSPPSPPRYLLFFFFSNSRLWHLWMCVPPVQQSLLQILLITHHHRFSLLFTITNHSFINRFCHWKWNNPAFLCQRDSLLCAWCMYCTLFSMTEGACWRAMWLIWWRRRTLCWAQNTSLHCWWWFPGRNLILFFWRSARCISFADLWPRHMNR